MARCRTKSRVLSDRRVDAYGSPASTDRRVRDQRAGLSQKERKRGGAGSRMPRKRTGASEHGPTADREPHRQLRRPGARGWSGGAGPRSLITGKVLACRVSIGSGLAGRTSSSQVARRALTMECRTCRPSIATSGSPFRIGSRPGLRRSVPRDVAALGGGAWASDRHRVLS